MKKTVAKRAQSPLTNREFHAQSVNDVARKFKRKGHNVEIINHYTLATLKRMKKEGKIKPYINM